MCLAILACAPPQADTVRLTTATANKQKPTRRDIIPVQ
jgi:hypothetical protein